MREQLKITKVPDEWILSRGKGVTVVVIDSHVNPVKNKLKKYYTISNGGNYDNSHGSSVCDIISSVAPLCEIIASQAIFGKAGDNDGLLMAMQNVKDDDFDVINFSLSTRDDKEDIKSLVYSMSQKALVVASMANDGSVSYPAQYDFVTSVSSYKNNNNMADICCNDNFYFNERKIKKTGNSMSTAFVSGIFALAKSYNKNFTKEDIFKILLGK